MKRKELPIIDVTPEPLLPAVQTAQRETPNNPLERWLPAAFQHPQDQQLQHTKQVALVNAVTGAKQHLTLAVGTRPKDLLRSMGIASPYAMITRGHGGEPFPENANLFQSVRDGDVLYIASRVVAGNDSIAQAVLHAKALSGRQAHASAVVERSTEAYWKEQGWRQANRSFYGHYKTKYGWLEGEMEQRLCGDVEPRVLVSLEAQQKLRLHRQWLCFKPQQARPGWYEVNLMVKAKDPSSAILEIENIITEAYEQPS